MIEIVKKGTRENPRPLKLWLYGVPTSGKTFIARKFPNPLMLNTDGNYDGDLDDVIIIKDETIMEGPMKKEVYGADKFEEAVNYLLNENHGYKTVIVDLIEDIYAMYVYRVTGKKNVEHVLDIGFGKGTDMVKTKFFDIMRRLTTQDDFNVIFCSHEIQKQTTKLQNGKMEQITVYDNPLQDKIYNKLLGMTTVVGRVVPEASGRKIKFKKDDTTFGGARGKTELDVAEINCDYNELIEMLRRNKIPFVGDTKATKSTPTHTQTDTIPEVKRRAL